MMPDRGGLATYFDRWYAEMAAAPAKDEIMQHHLRLPSYLLSTSTISWDGIGELETALRLGADSRLLDLACGRGGIGLEIAGRAGARLIGVDVSAEAVRQARASARRLKQEADFHVADLTATGLDARSVDAVLCVDSLQFADPAEDAYREIRRVVAPGARVVLTGWEPLDGHDDRLPARLRDVDLAAGLTAAGFDDVQVSEQPEWREAERRMWQEAVELSPDRDAALQAFREEGVRALQTFILLRRVSATATAPWTRDHPSTGSPCHPGKPGDRGELSRRRAGCVPGT
ncbi:MAG: class I SAM-dependent methyltransferase [Nocardioidaceae bacterium]